MCIASSGVVSHTHTLQPTVYAAIPPSVCRLLSQALNLLSHYTDPSPFILPVLHPDIVFVHGLMWLKCMYWWWGSLMNVFVLSMPLAREPVQINKVLLIVTF